MGEQYVDPVTGWLLPVHGGIVTQGYGLENTDPSVRHLYIKGYHTGIDIGGVAEGTDIFSPCDGVVSIAGLNRGYGLCVVIERGGGQSVLFGHLSRLDVEVGQQVHAGDGLGGVGTTGVSTGVHLHYEYRLNDVDIDPAPFLVPAIPEGLPGIKATVKEALNLRSGPSKNDPIILTAGAGTPVVIGKAGWAPVVVGGREGWMWLEFLSVKGQ